MKKLTAGLMAVAGLMVAKPAAAITLDTPTLLCISSLGFNHCITATLTQTGGALAVELENMSGAGYDNYDVTSIAFFRYGTGPTLALASQNPLFADLAAAGDWTDGYLMQSFGQNPPPGSTLFGGASTGMANGTRFAPGAVVTLTFDISGDDPWDLGEFGFGFRGQNAYGGEGSFRCWEGGSSSTDNGDELCGPPTVVPEPATMALLATGLVGLGGAGLVRRRRQQNV